MASRRTRLRRKPKSNFAKIALGVFAVLTVARAHRRYSLAPLRRSGSCRSGSRTCPTTRPRTPSRSLRPRRIYSADGKLLARLYLENREVVPLSQISPYLVNAIVAVEDERFYSHKGVDPDRSRARGCQDGVGQSPGRLDHHAAVHPQHHSARRAHGHDVRAQGPRGVPGARAREAPLEARHPRDVPQHHLSGRRRVRGPGRIARVLQPPGEQAHAAAGRAARGPRRSRRAASTPTTTPRAQSLAATRCSAACSRTTTSRRPSTTRPSPRSSSSSATRYPTTASTRRPTSLRTSRSSSRSSSPPATVFKGGLTVYTTLDTPAAEVRRASGQAEAAPQERPAGRAGVHRSAHRATSRRSLAAVTTGRASSTSRPRGTASRARRSRPSCSSPHSRRACPPQCRIDSSSPAVIPSKPKPWIVDNSEGAGRGMMTLQSATAASVNTVFARVAWAARHQERGSHREAHGYHDQASRSTRRSHSARPT